MEEGKWVDVDELPLHQIHSITKQVRQVAHTKISTHRLYDLDGNLAKEWEEEITSIAG